MVNTQIYIIITSKRCFWFRERAAFIHFWQACHPVRTLCNLLCAWLKKISIEMPYRTGHSSVYIGRYVHHHSTEGLAHPCVWMKRLYQPNYAYISYIDMPITEWIEKCYMQNRVGAMKQNRNYGIHRERNRIVSHLVKVNSPASEKQTFHVSHRQNLYLKFIYKFKQISAELCRAQKYTLYRARKTS